MVKAKSWVMKDFENGEGKIEGGEGKIDSNEGEFVGNEVIRGG